jgi:hypothetical protein
MPEEGEEFEDTKGVIRIRISKKNKQHNGQKKKHKTTNNDLPNIHMKLKNTNPTKNRGELRGSGRVSSSCSTRDTPVISHELGRDREVFTTSGTYLWSFVTKIFHSGQPSHCGDRNTFEVMTST